jgi:hypothetical protein
VFDYNLGRGSLIGDKAAEWGEFNLDEFQSTTARETA